MYVLRPVWEEHEICSSPIVTLVRRGCTLMITHANIGQWTRQLQRDNRRFILEHQYLCSYSVIIALVNY